MCKIIAIFISILLVLNIFQKKLKCLLTIKTLKQIFTYDLLMCGYFCIGFINLMLAGKTLIKYTNLFSPNNFKKNDDILNYFKF